MSDPHANPPPPGVPLHDSDVTHDMSAWAVQVLHSSLGLFQTTQRDFDGRTVIAWVCWHPPDPPVGPDAWHRGVTLCWPLPDRTSTVPSPAIEYAEGIDVSHWQGPIDWTAVAGAGKAFAFIKVSDGLGPDVTSAYNIKAADEAGLLVGGYHYFRPGLSPAAQADYFRSSLGNATLPAVLDVEEFDGLEPSLLRDRIAAWTEAAGGSAIIYTGVAFYTEGAIPDGSELWIAQWGVAAPSVPSWRVWQYTDRGSVPGIRGQVDLDRYNGTVGDLTAWAASCSK